MQFSETMFNFDRQENHPDGFPLVLAVGVFDGVHLGHRKIIESARKMADDNGAEVCAVTFEPHPKSLFGEAPELLVNGARRRKLLLQAGADCTAFINFTAETAALEPEEFLLRLINDPRFRLAGICVGEHWHFGSKGKGGKELIETFSQKYGFLFCAVPEIEDGSDVISSSLIRSLIKAGSLDRAALLLSRNPELCGKVVRGFGVAGKELSAPTANLNVEYGVIPPDGVYAARVHLDGNTHAAAVNIGIAPTYGVGARRVEIHLLDWQGVLYGRELSLEIVRFVRKEQKFNGPSELKAQIIKDIAFIKSALE